MSAKKAAVASTLVLKDDSVKTVKKLKVKLSALVGKKISTLTEAEKDLLLQIVLERLGVVDDKGVVL